MCDKMYENVKSLDYTKKFLQSDSNPATNGGGHSNQCRQVSDQQP